MSQQQFGRRAEEPQPGPEAPAAPRAHARASTDDLDALLDQIDHVLESTPQDYVRSYVQKGGQ